MDTQYKVTVTLNVTADLDVNIEQLKRNIAKTIPMELFITHIEVGAPDHAMYCKCSQCMTDRR